MSDEPADTGVEASPAPGAEAAAGKGARDLEFTLFYTEQLPRLVAFLIVQGAHPGLAADVAQDAMIEAYRQWDEIERPRAWIRTVASRAWWRRLQRDRAEDARPEWDDVVLAADAAEPEELENRHVLLTVLESLPPRQRQVMAWTYDGYLPTEIATLLGIPAATVRSRLRDARAALRRRYGPAEEKP